MDGSRDYQWRWHPVFKDYYRFRRRGVAGTTEHDLIWARSMIGHDEQLPTSPNTSTPPSGIDQSESSVDVTVMPFPTNNAMSFNQISSSQIPGNTVIQGQFRDFPPPIPHDFNSRVNNSSSPLYSFVGHFASLPTDGSMTSVTGPRTATPTTSADTPRIPYPEPTIEPSTDRHEEDAGRATSPLDPSTTSMLDTHEWMLEGYETIRNPRGYFKKGRVFKVSWPEPKGELSSNAARPTIPERSDITQPSLSHINGELDALHASSGTSNTAALHVKTRIFVVIRPRAQHCLCLPIYTYSHQGTAKAGVKPEDHAPLIKESTTVEFHPDEQQSKLKKAIYLILEDSTMQWSPLSRINLTKVQTVEYNLKVRTVGRVSPECLVDLENLFRDAIGLSDD